MWDATRGGSNTIVNIKVAEDMMKNCEDRNERRSTFEELNIDEKLILNYCEHRFE